MDLRNIALNIYQKTLDRVPSDEDWEGLSSPEKAFIKRLIMTAFRKQEGLKKVMRRFMTKALPQKLNLSHYAIILGAVEILYFRTPNYAVLNSYVDIVKKRDNKYGGGFVNAVLRKIALNRDDILLEERPLFFPSSFVNMLKKSYDGREIAKIEKASLIEPPVDITVKQNAPEWAERLGGKVMDEGTVRIFSAGIISELEGYQEGEWWVQDLASSQAVKTLGDIAGKKVLDLCAAPGGKTAQLINAGGKVTALDISESRLVRLRENLERLNLQAEKIITADALDYLQETKDNYDIILLDAPCSATGTLRRHPELVHTKAIDDVLKSTEVQKKMLVLAAKKLTQNGTLLYAVCSLSKLEGEEQVKDFLSSHDRFRLIKEVRCLPYQLEKDGGIDGFYIAKLVKEN